MTDILTNDEISLLRSLEKKSRTIIGNFTHKRYDRLETKGYIKRSSQSPSMQDILYEITDAGKAALRAAGGGRVEIRTKTVWSMPIRFAHEPRPDSGVDQRGSVKELFVGNAAAGLL